MRTSATSLEVTAEMIPEMDSLIARITLPEGQVTNESILEEGDAYEPLAEPLDEPSDEPSAEPSAEPSDEPSAELSDGPWTGLSPESEDDEAEGVAAFDEKEDYE